MKACLFGLIPLVMLLAGSCQDNDSSGATGSDRTSASSPLQLVIMGPPGAGKGTQAKKIAELYGIPHISTGAVLRSEIEKDTELGRQVKTVIERGDLVADEIVLKLVETRLGEPDCGKGFILDGFPRTLAQSEGLDAILSKRGTPGLIAINLSVPEEVLLDRLHSRGRADDTRETIQNRIRVYNEKTTPLIEYYAGKGVLMEINGDQTIDAVFADIKGVLGSD